MKLEHKIFLHWFWSHGSLSSLPLTSRIFQTLLYCCSTSEKHWYGGYYNFLNIWYLWGSRRSDFICLQFEEGNNELSKKLTICMNWAAWPLVNYLNTVVGFCFNGEGRGENVVTSWPQEISSKFSPTSILTWFHSSAVSKWIQKPFARYGHSSTRSQTKVKTSLSWGKQEKKI